MKIYGTFLKASAFAAASLALLPVAALASPLLSGYGGPGTGEQQILGATLVGGGGGHRGGGGQGRGSGNTSAGAGRAAGPTAHAQSPPAAAGGSQVGSGPSTPTGGAGEAGTGTGIARGSGGGAGTGSGGGSSRGSGRGSGGNEAGSQRRGATAPQIPPAVEAAARRSSTLGLSGGQIAMVATILAALVATGLMTWWLGRLQLGGEAADRGRMKASSR